MLESSDFLPLFLESCIIGQSLFSIIYLASTHWTQNKWLVLTFVSTLLPIVGLLLGLHQLNVLSYPIIDNPGFILLNTPAFFLYSAQLVNIPFRRSHRFLMFLPFVVFYILFLLVPPPNPRLFLIEDQSAFELSIRIGLIIFLFVQIFAYCFGILRIIHTNQKKYKDEYADKNIFITLDWIKWCTIIYLVISILAFAMIPVLHLVSDNMLPSWFAFLIMLALIYVISFFSFRQPQLYNIKSDKLPNLDKMVNPKETLLTEKSTTVVPCQSNHSKKIISKEKQTELINELENYMNVEQPYLNKEIRMPDLAAAMGVSTNIFSYLINEYYKNNFFRFINEYRVDYAASLLKDENYEHYTLESIGQMSGFKSKSTFNGRFKEFKGMSPSQYKKK